MESPRAYSITNEEWVSFLFSDLPEGATPWALSFYDSPKIHRNWFGAAIAVGQKLAAESNGPWMSGFSEASNNYLSVASVRGARRKENFAALHALMVDDVGTKVDQQRLVLPPALKLETSPGNQQWWYALEVPVTDPVIADLLIVGAITALVGSNEDPGMGSIVRYGRMPIGSNTKTGVAVPQRVLEWIPRKVSVEKLAASLKVSLVPPKKPKGKRSAPPKAEGSQNLLPWLLWLEWVKKECADGSASISCPLADHDDDGRTFYWPPSEKWPKGGFYCHHGKCKDRHVSDLKLAVALALAEKGVL